MKIEDVIAAYNEAAFDTDRDKALEIIRAAVANGLTPEEVIFEVVLPALEQAVKSISANGDLNLAQHFMISQIAAEVADEMIPRFTQAPTVIGHIVIGTAQGDLHSLGKQIVIGCLKARMIAYTDLGVNVTPERFVDEAVAQQAQVIGISAMMVHTARGENGCLGVRRLLKERGLESKIRLIVGGAPFRFDQHLYQIVQADAWAEDGITAGKVITDLIQEART